MSIQSELTRLSSNVSDALTAIANKGVTVPTGSNSDDLATLIGQIQTGGGGTGAISIVDTPDAAGGTVRTITAVDISDTTAVAGDVAQGKYFYTADGTKTAGTASGGGSGLVYEEGTYTPASDNSQPTISFANTHSELPLLVTMEDATGTYDGTTDTNYYFAFMNFSGFTGKTIRQSSTSQIYAMAYYMYRTSNATSLTPNNALITNAPDSQSSGPATYANWITTSSFSPGSNNTSRYWRSGRTYKWIAVWAPTA